MLINCDIGERGPKHAIDDQLMGYIDMANIACGGHAGNEESIAYYYSLAKKLGIKASVHLSYPDPINFGRKVMDISENALLNSLDQQYCRLDEVKTLKLHGALYNEANSNQKLAQVLMRWARSSGIQEVLCPEHSAVAKCCSITDDALFEDFEQIQVIHEVFLDRQYVYEDNVLGLMSRKRPDALLSDTDDAIKQYQDFMNGFIVIDDKKYSIKADTGCIHSDSEHVLKLIRAIKRV